MSSIVSASSAVDLSRLPSPTIVEQLSYREIWDAILTDLTTLLPSFDATVESDPAVKVLQVSAYRELLIRQQFNDRAKQVMIAYATGANLDQLGALLNVSRLLLTAADPDAGTAAVYEDDTAFRRRIVLAPESFSVAGPDAAYVYWALSAAASIAGATATSPAPGEVLISLLSANNDGRASAAEIAAVVDVVNAPGKRPLTDHVTVVSAAIVPYVVEARLTLFAGPDATVIVAAARARLEAWIARSRAIGRDVTRAAIIAQLAVEGVQDVTLVKPAANIVIGDTQCAACAGIDVAAAGYAS